MNDVKGLEKSAYSNVLAIVNPFFLAISLRCFSLAKGILRSIIYMRTSERSSCLRFL